MKSKKKDVRQIMKVTKREIRLLFERSEFE